MNPVSPPSPPPPPSETLPQKATTNRTQRPGIDPDLYRSPKKKVSLVRMLVLLVLLAVPFVFGVVFAPYFEGIKETQEKPINTMVSADTADTYGTMYSNQPGSPQQENYSPHMNCTSYGTFKQEELDTTYLTTDGDTYESISMKLYGSKEYAADIRSRNKNISIDESYDLDYPLEDYEGMTLEEMRDEYSTLLQDEYELEREISMFEYITYYLPVSEHKLPFVGGVELNTPHASLVGREKANVTAGELLVVKRLQLGAASARNAVGITYYYPENSLRNPTTFTEDYDIKDGDCVIFIAEQGNVVIDMLDQRSLLSLKKK